MPPATDRKAAVRILFITIFLDLLGFGIIIPQLPYYADRCGAGGTIIGLVGSSYSLLQFLMAPFWGRLSDRIGRRPIVLIGLAGAGMSYIVFGAAFHLAALTGTGPIPWLFFARALAGFFNANIATAQAYMADVTPGGDRAAAMGLVGAAFGLGFVLGPVVSIGVTLATHSQEMPFYVAGASSLLTFLWALRALPESRDPGIAPAPGRAAGRFALARVPGGPLKLAMVIYFLSTFAMAGMENTLGLFVMKSPQLRYTEMEFGKLLLYLGLMIAFTQGWAVKRLAAWIPTTRMLAIGAAVMIFGLGGTAFVVNTPQLLLTVFLICFGYGLVSPSLSTLTSFLAPESIRGEVLGVGQSMASLGRIVGPTVGGWAFQEISPGSPYLISGVLSAVCTALAVVLAGMVRPEETR